MLTITLEISIAGMEMSRGVICKIHQDYYPIEETNLWHTM